MNIRQWFGFVILNASAWCVLSLGYFYTSGFAGDSLGILFTVTFIIGHVFLFAWGCGLVCLPFAWVGPRALELACIAAGSLFSLFWATDWLVYSQYRFHLSPAMLELFFGPAGREIFVFSNAMWGGIILAVVLVVAAQSALVYWAKRMNPSRRLIAGCVGAWLVFFVLYNGLYAWGKFKMYPSIVAQRGVLPFANPLSANRRLRKMGFEPQKDPYTQPPAGSLVYPLHPLLCNPHEKAKNVLILLVESWRADSVNEQVMPQLTRLAKLPQMTYFTNHLSGGNATEAGVFSLFYSMPYAYWNDFTSRQLPPVLVSQALQQGYVPAIYSSGKLNSPTFHQNVFATVPNLRLESDGTTKWERDVDAVEDFEQFLTNYSGEKPFFGFVFLDAPHGSSYPQQDRVFTPAQEINYLWVNKNTDPTPYMNQYKNSVHFADRMIERIFNALQQHRLLDNTLIIITADHGQEINDTRHNFWGHNSNFSNYQTQVPLFVWNGPARPGSLSYRTTHYDVAPTILQEVYRCTNPPQDYSIGQNLFDPAPRPFAVISSYTKKAVRTQDQLTVLDAYGGIENYNSHFEPSPGAQPAAIKEALKTFAQFYK